jgi:putative spermidine/putrescine transport system permease protein
MRSMRATHLSWLQAAPFSLVLLTFFGVPMALIVVVSFCEYETGDVIFKFTTENYREILTSRLTYDLYARSLYYTAVVWFFTLLIGFWVSFFLAFHVRPVKLQIALFLICTVPFLTSLIIRMISWIPILGREGVINRSLLQAGAINRPLDWLLYSDFSVIVAYVHLYTLFMIVPIFNAMARIEPAVIGAARDAGASPWQIITNIVVPLSKSGMALGTVFIIALVMGDFFVVRVMSGGQRASVVSALFNEIAALQYPPAAANAVILVIFVTIMIALTMRVVDVRKELVE